MYKTILLFLALAFSSYNVMASCHDIGEGGGGGSICCSVKGEVLECEDSLG